MPNKSAKISKKESNAGHMQVAATMFHQGPLPDPKTLQHTQTNYVKAELALRLEDIISKRAKENQLASQNNEQSAVHLKSDKQINTNQELAKIAGVGTDTI